MVRIGRAVPYVVFVGKLSKRRNVPNLIQAFCLVKEKHRLPHKLLIIGPNTSGLPLPDLLSVAGGDAVVKHLPYLEMESLAKIYAGAALYVLPTTYEGISQTMFEAMASGTPVLSVDHPTLAEGGGDAVMSVPSPSVEDLSGGLEMLLLNDAMRHALSQKGRQRASLFSWAATAGRTMEILDKVARPNDSRG